MNHRALPASVLMATLLAPATGAADGRHVLWTIDGENNTVYLLGSLHVLRPQDGSLPSVADAAYADAERLVMEIDMDEALADPASLVQAEAMLPEGQSLREVLAADYARVAEQAHSAGFELELLDRFAPWFVAVTLMQLELENHGFSAELGVEQTLTRRAVADRKPIAGLETAAQQFATFGRMPLPEQKRLLLMTLEETANMRFPELYGPLTENRNRAWVPQLVDLLDDDDDYLVVVGALHLVGRNSVIDLLEQRGYDVVQH